MQCKLMDLFFVFAISVFYFCSVHHAMMIKTFSRKKYVECMNYEVYIQFKLHGWMQTWETLLHLSVCACLPSLQTQTLIHFCIIYVLNVLCVLMSCSEYCNCGSHCKKPRYFYSAFSLNQNNWTNLKIESKMFLSIVLHNFI